MTPVESWFQLVLFSRSIMFHSATSCAAAHQASLSLTISQSLLKRMSIGLVMPSNHLILLCPFSSCPQSFPELGSFPMSWLNTSGSQSIGAPVSASTFSMNIQGWIPFRFTNLISLLSKGLSSVFSSTTVQKHQFFITQLSLWFSSHILIWLLEKTIALTIQTFVGKVMSLLEYAV